MKHAILLDIEGTTTPITFVHDVLFPYARARLAEFLNAHRDAPDVADAVARLTAEHAAHVAGGHTPPAWPSGTIDADLVRYLEWLMDRDCKSPGLKLLQGLIWERGYQAGELRGQVFPDVPPAIRRWHGAGVAVAIYSSGSELAQRRLFESTEHGDLTPLLAGFFDTAVGPKTSPDSYRRIATALGLPPGEVLFVSDVVKELTAAREAGLDVRLAVRPGNAPVPDGTGFAVVRTFDHLLHIATTS